MATNDPHIRLRIPRDLKDWVSDQARQNASSQNSEIVRALRERQQRGLQAAPHEPVKDDADGR